MAHIQVYRDKSRWFRKTGRYRWRVVASNGRILAVSSFSYANLGDLWNGVRCVTDALAGSLGRSVPVHEGTPPIPPAA